MGRKILKLLDVVCVGACVHLKDKERESASAERERRDEHVVWARGPVCVCVFLASGSEVGSCKV